VVPALIVKLVFRQRLADYGMQLGDRVRTVRSFLVFAPVMLLVAWLSSQSAAMTGEYPIDRTAGSSASAFALHTLTYLFFYAGWEFHFRGFLQFGLRKAFGDAGAILVAVLASVLLHLGKPAAETYGAIAAGLLWGILAFRTRSLLSGFLQHALLGISLDAFIAFG
jgi:membrane protease YdiL (CAAX protease family)